MKKPEINLDERKQIQLEMLVEIDKFCRANNIKYSLAFGTLLGAIRHKGFIPWDDDVDIMMPLSDMMRVKNEFHSDIVKYIDVDNEKHYKYPFSKFVDLKTYSVEGFNTKGYGVNIDLYPQIPLPSDQETFFEEAEKLQEHRLKMLKLRSKVIFHTPLHTIPGFRNAIRKYRDYLFHDWQSRNSEVYYIVAGPLPLREKMTYDFDLFSKMEETEFEGKRFMITSYYDKYLTMRYGDYMQLPPEEDRHPYHGGRFYWK